MAYHPKSLRFLSVLQIIVGSISLLLGVASAVLLTDFNSIIGFGIWVGVWISVAGLLGFFGSRDPQVPSRCLLGTFLGFTITACLMAVAMLVCYAIALAFLSDCLRIRSEWNQYSTRYYYPSYCNGLYVSDSSLYAGIGIDTVLFFISVLEFAVGLASSIYCCAALCYNGNYSPVQGTQQVVHIQPAGMGQVLTAGGGMVLMSGGPSGTVVQPPAGQYIIHQPGQPTVVPVSQPGPISMQQYVASQTHPAPVAGGVLPTGEQTARTQPHRDQDAPPAYT